MADLRRELRVERQVSTQLREDLAARPGAEAFDRFETDHKAREAELLLEIDRLRLVNDVERADAATRHLQTAAELAREREIRREEGRRAADELDAMAGQLQGAKQHNAALESRVSTLVLERLSLLEANASAMEAVTRLGAQVDSIDARRAELERQVTCASANLHVAAERLSALAEQKKDLEAKLTARAEALATGEAAYAVLSDTHKAVLRSRSWKVTRGLRLASSWSSRLRRAVWRAS